MTGDLAVAPRPALVERAPSTPAAPGPRSAVVAVGRSVVGPPSTGEPNQLGSEESGAARLKARLADPNVRVRAHRDEASARLVLQVLDRATGEVIEQYPPDELLRFYAALRESLGALVDQHA